MTKWIGSAVLLLSAISAAADRPERSGPAMGVVAVAEPPAGPSQELTELTTSLRAAVSQRSPGVLSPQDLRQRMLTRSPSASLSELDRAYAGAVAAHQSGDFEGAVRSLSAVLTDLERMPDGPETFSQWSRALLRLARAQGSLGRKADAEESMKRLLRADPTANADPELYPPSFQRQLEEARKQLAAAPKHKLVVKGPKGAKVFVEGREVADAPATLTLAAGQVPGHRRAEGRPRHLGRLRSLDRGSGRHPRLLARRDVPARGRPRALRLRSPIGRRRSSPRAPRSSSIRCSPRRSPPTATSASSSEPSMTSAAGWWSARGGSGSRARPSRTGASGRSPASSSAARARAW